MNQLEILPEMLEYYKSILERISFDKELFNKEYQNAMKNLNQEEKDELEKWISETKLLQKVAEGELFERILYLLLDMGYFDKVIKLEEGLDFDYLDLADFLIRIENEFKIEVDIKPIPGIKYPQFESIKSTIEFLSAEYNII